MDGQTSRIRRLKNDAQLCGFAPTVSAIYSKFCSCERLAGRPVQGGSDNGEAVCRLPTTARHVGRFEDTPNGFRPLHPPTLPRAIRTSPRVTSEQDERTLCEASRSYIPVLPFWANLACCSPASNLLEGVRLSRRSIRTTAGASPPPPLPGASNPWRVDAKVAGTATLMVLMRMLMLMLVLGLGLVFLGGERLGLVQLAAELGQSVCGVKFEKKGARIESGLQAPTVFSTDTPGIIVVVSRYSPAPRSRSLDDEPLEDSDLGQTRFLCPESKGNTPSHPIPPSA